MMLLNPKGEIGGRVLWETEETAEARAPLLQLALCGLPLAQSLALLRSSKAWHRLGLHVISVSVCKAA